MRVRVFVGVERRGHVRGDSSRGRYRVERKERAKDVGGLGGKRKQEAARIRMGIDEGTAVAPFLWRMNFGREAQSGSRPQVKQRGEEEDRQTPRPAYTPSSCVLKSNGQFLASKQFCERSQNMPMATV